jgi:hypothetical protein
MISGGAPTTPAGSSGDIQYNNGGTFGGVTLVPLANADLSATGGASKFLKQASTGAAITVAQPAFTDLTGAATVAQGTVPSFTSQGQGHFWSLNVSDAGIGGTATIISPTGNNVVCVFQFVLPYAITVSRIVFAKGGTVVAGSHANFGIYDMSRNRLIDSGQFDTSSGGSSVQSNSITAVPLLPGGVLLCTSRHGFHRHLRHQRPEHNGQCYVHRSQPFTSQQRPPRNRSKRPIRRCIAFLFRQHYGLRQPRPCGHSVRALKAENFSEPPSPVEVEGGPNPL